MMKVETKGRTYNSIRNTITGVSTQVVIVLLNFIVRTFFIKYLAVEYLGVNGLFSNILMVLSVAELGFGSAVQFALYKPSAVSNKMKIAGLTRYYIKVYRIMGTSIFALGLLIIPLLDDMIKTNVDIKDLELIYILFLFSSVLPYFFSHNRSLIQTAQKYYVLSLYTLNANLFKTTTQVLVLIYTSDFILFLIIQLISILLENLLINIKANRMYPYIKKSKQTLTQEEKKDLWVNVKALIIYKIGSAVLDGTDLILISAFVGVASAGIISNYLLIIGSASMLMQQVTNAITASIGNFIALEEAKASREKLLQNLTYIYFLFYGISAIYIFLLINPFIGLWIGDDFMLSENIALVLAINWYLYGIMNPVWLFRNTMGLFVYGKYRPLVSAIVNLLLSIILVNYLGVIGVLLGTTLTRVMTNLWYDPFIIYRYGIKKAVWPYYFSLIKQIIILGISIVILYELFEIIDVSSFGTAMLEVALCAIIPYLLIWICYRHTEAHAYVSSMIASILKKAYMALARNRNDKM